MTTYIERVAIVGATGHIGSQFTQELLKTGKHTIAALTRPDSTSSIPEGVKKVEVNYDDHESLVAALKDQQFLIITLSVRAPPETHDKLLKAASDAGVPYVMPNVYANDLQDESLREQDLYGAAALQRCRDVEKHGNTAFIAMICGFWYEWSLAMGEHCFGFDIHNKTATFFDDGTTRVTASSFGQCGRAVAALLSLPESGATPSVSAWKNKFFYINSFSISQRDVLDSLHRVMGTTDADWTITTQPTEERYQEGLAELRGGNRTGFAKAMYTRVFYKNGGGDFSSTRGVVNETIGLAADDLDAATKRAVDIVNAGGMTY